MPPLSWHNPFSSAVALYCIGKMINNHRSDQHSRCIVVVNARQYFLASTKRKERKIVKKRKMKKRNWPKERRKKTNEGRKKEIAKIIQWFLHKCSDFCLNAPYGIHWAIRNAYKHTASSATNLQAIFHCNIFTPETFCSHSIEWTLKNSQIYFPNFRLENSMTCSYFQWIISN